MAIIKCRSCGRDTSDQEERCILCNAPINAGLQADPSGGNTTSKSRAAQQNAGPGNADSIDYEPLEYVPIDDDGESIELFEYIPIDDDSESIELFEYVPIDDDVKGIDTIEHTPSPQPQQADNPGMHSTYAPQPNLAPAQPAQSAVQPPPIQPPPVKQRRINAKTAIIAASLLIVAIIAGVFLFIDLDVQSLVGRYSAADSGDNDNSGVNADTDATAQPIGATDINDVQPTSAAAGITINLGSSLIERGNTHQFSVSVQGQNNPPQDVSWAVAGNSSTGTTIRADGLLTVAENETADTLTITATVNHADPVSVSVSVNISEPSQPDYITIRNRQYSTGLTSLDLSEFRDLQNEEIAPLRHMTNLTELSFLEGLFSDLTPLSGLTNLRVLSLVHANVSDLTPLRNLTNLNILILAFANVSDLTPLSGLTNLAELYLWGNQVSDLSPLLNLINLRVLILDGNHVSDLTPLSGLTILTSVSLDGNPVADWSPIAHVPLVGGMPSPAIIAIASGSRHTVGLRADGTVVAAGSNSENQCEVSSWTGIAAISAGGMHTLGLRADGTVVAAGRNSDGQCDVSSWTDIVAIANDYNYSVGLKADGTVVVAGSYSEFIQDYISAWRDIVAISVRDMLILGLKADGTVEGFYVPYSSHVEIALDVEIIAINGGVYLTADGNAYNIIIMVDKDGVPAYIELYEFPWTDIAAISNRPDYTVGLKNDGTVVVESNGFNDYGQYSLSSWTDIIAVSAGDSHTVGLKANGTVVAAGLNVDGQCEVQGW